MSINTLRLGDFTDVGYMSGDVPIPDWPIGCNVTDFGAVKDPIDDTVDSSDAFMAAIQACPNNTAVFVPKGKYVILKQIRVERDYFVLRGEDMYETVLYFPKYLEEVTPKPYQRPDGSDGYQGGFFHVDGGTHRSIEHLTFEFRPQTKMGFFEFRGANAIKYTGDAQDSWIRNIRIRNSDFGVKLDGALRFSIMHIYIDDYINRPGFVEALFYIRQVSFVAIGMGKVRKCLFWNIEQVNDSFHDYDLISAPNYNVVSQVKGPSIALQHHARGAHHNLYTDVDCGVGSGAHGLDDSRDMHHETYWNIRRVDRGWPEHTGADFLNAKNSSHIFVGYAVQIPEEITETFWYEDIDPEALVPQNIYLAQLDVMGKAHPTGSLATPPLPVELTGDVRMLNPTDDVSVGADPSSYFLPFEGYLKFDLTNLQDLPSISKATLKISTKTRTDTNFVLTAYAVDDDGWTEDSITIGNEPLFSAPLDSVFIDDNVKNKWWSLDVTVFVQQEWAADKVVSLYLNNDVTGTFLGSMHSRESGNAPLLVIERVPDPVPGPPAPPTGISTYSEDGHILLDWDDNTDGDIAYYNVYRSPAPNGGHPVAQGLTISEWADISAKEDRGWCEMPSDVLYTYHVTAVDTHGYESAWSEPVFGNTLDPSNLGPSFSVVNYVLANTLVSQDYLASIASEAVDPENDPLSFSKISGPSWLEVSPDGTISGVPPMVGSFRVRVQVNAIGGRDEACFLFNVVSDLSSNPVIPAELYCATPAPTQTPTSSRKRQLEMCSVYLVAPLTNPLLFVNRQLPLVSLVKALVSVTQLVQILDGKWT